MMSNEDEDLIVDSRNSIIIIETKNLRCGGKELPRSVLKGFTRVQRNVGTYCSNPTIQWHLE